MTTLALYNKWRGQTFDDILGQEHITTTLRNQIRAGRIGHAYLFTGLRGTGKTSTARILAKAINCVGGVDDPPCNRCHICTSLTEGRSLDLVEIDGASNRGVDEIRDLRDRVSFSPNECRYKVYVIDEVHMLTREAFNALLKTLEEPPAHVVFILCTTEPHRLPDTVLSRCQRFDFRRGSLASITAKLRTICEREGLAIQPDALEFIARRATGSFRDAESLLDQLSAYGATEITLEQVRGILGTVSASLVGGVVGSLVSGDVPAGLRAINEAFDGGAEPRQFAADVLEYLRALMLLSVGGADGLESLGPETIEDLRVLTASEGYSLGLVVRAIRLFSEATQALRYAVRPELPLELALVEATLPVAATAEPAPQPQRAARPAARSASPRPQAPVAAPPPEERVVTPPQVAVEKPAVESAPPPPRPAPETAPTPATPAPVREPEPAPAAAADAPATGAPAAAEGEQPGRGLTLDWVRGHWQKVLMHVRSNSRNVEALLKSVEPVEVRGNLIALGCESEFHCTSLSEEHRRVLVEQALTAVLGVPCAVTCHVMQDYRAARPGPASGAPGDIFQAAEPHRSAEEQLLNHPAVKEMQRQGGRITRVRVHDVQDTEEERGE